MSAEPTRVTKTEAWTQWEGQVVNGTFPLRRYLGGSDHSAVFLTEYKAANLGEVAIKFVLADTVQTQAQLVQWGTAATLSHPHLVRIFDVGRCQFGGRGFLFVVMEYAEQTLAQILPRRALTPDEVREMLLPTLDALAFLHRNHLVHGQLKPSNFLVVNDQLKLASDSVRPTGSAPSGIARASLYDPPELKGGGSSAAGDIWGLGMTLTEALTQRTPGWSDEKGESAQLPASLPAPFADIVRRCLSRTPANRPGVAELEAQYKPAPPAPVIPVPQPPAREASREATPAQNLSKKRPLLRAFCAVLLISLAAWAGLRFFQQYSNSPQSASAPPQAPVQPPSGSPAPEPAASVSAVPAPATPAMPAATTTTATDTTATTAPATTAPATTATATTATAAAAPGPGEPPAPPEVTSLSVPHEVVPEVSQVILDKIRGHINVTVRVLVDPSGDVVGEFLENPGPSRYFARLASDAAVGWKFAPTDDRGPRVWLVRFEFTRDGVTTNSTAAQ
jgi:serine/threonine protein kinase